MAQISTKWECGHFGKLHFRDRGQLDGLTAEYKITDIRGGTYYSAMKCRPCRDAAPKAERYLDTTGTTCQRCGTDCFGDCTASR